MADSLVPDADRRQDAMGAIGADDAFRGQPTDLRCCCGREDCVFLQHNCSVLLSVERDVHAAAKMGQTLLMRHEAYMASAERDRMELNIRIEQLERDNAELEARNKRATEENHTLRDEVEHLNEAVKDADTKIELLEATLRDSQREARRLDAAAARAATLEREIAALEEEQATLQETIVHTQEEARTAMYRWRQAEKGISDLQEQLERMEKEAREERERHVEVLGRMERQRVVEKELDTAAGRLKGAAAAKALTDSKNGGNVVSHFVRDLLQDNASLQLSIAELREMLVSSHDEIQVLRDQLQYHQPVSNREAESPVMLRTELERKEPPVLAQPTMSQEFHIHHHYHVTHKPSTIKAKKRRQGLTAGTFTPPHVSVPSSPVQPPHWHHGSIAGALMSPPIQEVPVAANGRWSVMSENPSEFAPSSVPSSPQSNNRNSVFDRVVDVSFPTSPTTSVDPTSPAWRTSHRKQASDFSTRSGLGPGFPSEGPPPSYTLQPHPLTNFVLSGEQSPRRPPTAPYTTDDVPDQREEDLDDDSTTDMSGIGTGGEALSPMGQESFSPLRERRPRGLRRMTSHESIMSLSNGMDIHTLKARPSQLTFRPLGLTAAGTDLSAVTARPTLSNSSGKRSSVALRDTYALGTPIPKTRSGRWLPGSNRSVSSPIRGAMSPGSPPNTSGTSALGKLVSWRPWRGGTSSGANSVASPSPEGSPSATPILAPSLRVGPVVVSPAGSLTTTAMATATATAKPVSAGGTPFGSFRAPGINQPGMIPGFHEYWAAHQRRGAPSKVAVDDVQGVQEALREVLEEE